MLLEYELQECVQSIDRPAQKVTSPRGDRDAAAGGTVELKLHPATRQQDDGGGRRTTGGYGGGRVGGGIPIPKSSAACFFCCGRLVMVIQRVRGS